MMSKKISDLKDYLIEIIEDDLASGFTQEQIVSHCLVEFDHTLTNNPEESAIFYILLTRLLVQNFGSVSDGRVVQGLNQIKRERL